MSPLCNRCVGVFQQLCNRYFVVAVVWVVVVVVVLVVGVVVVVGGVGVGGGVGGNCNCS